MIDHTQGFVKTVVMVAAEWDVTLPWLEYPRAIKEVLYFIQFLWGAKNTSINSKSSEIRRKFRRGLGA